MTYQRFYSGGSTSSLFTETWYRCVAALLLKREAVLKICREQVICVIEPVTSRKWVDSPWVREEASLLTRESRENSFGGGWFADSAR
jgi:hypothetical protein